MVGKFYSLLLGLTIASSAAIAQCNQGITLDSQAAVDTFPSAYGCSIIGGSLIISGNDITNLDSLQQVTEISGELLISANPLLEDISGLSSLERVAGSSYPGPEGGLRILNNPKLTNLHAFYGLTELPAFLIIKGNDALLSLEGLNNLTSISRQLQIVNNQSLQNMDALANVTSIGRHDLYDGSVMISGNGALTHLNLSGVKGLEGGLEIINNASLTDLHGLDSLKVVTFGSLSIVGNASLQSVDGLDALTRAPNYFNVADNSVLENVDGFHSLVEKTSGGPDGYFLITNNISLTNLDGFRNLASVSSAQSHLYITGNTSLTNGCGIYPALSDGIDDTGFDGDISNNGPGVTIGGILANCIPADQLTCDRSIRLSTQEEVDAFPRNFGCTNVSGGLELEGNSIVNLDSLHDLGSVGNLRISETGLVDLTGLASITSVNGGPNCEYCFIDGIEITRNSQLTSLDGLSALSNVNGAISIINNHALKNVDGLQSLEGSLTGFVIVNNDSLTNLDGLSALATLGAPAEEVSFSVTLNNMLTRFCGLYTVITENEGLDIQFSGNGIATSEEQIAAGGPCNESEPGQPYNIQFTMITDTTMRVTFNSGEPAPAGYLVLMRAHNSPYPQYQPADGVEYHVGNLFGSSTIVVGKGNKTQFNIVYLAPGTTYHFVAFSYDSNFNYVTDDPLVGSATTVETPATQPSSIVFSDVTESTMTVSFSPSTSSAVDGYVTVMRASTPSYPHRVPVDGTPYSVGNLIGSSSIVVSSGTATTLYIVQLSPDTDYWFDVYSYTRDGNHYDYLTSTAPLEGMQRTESAPTAFPNPFTESVTIRFTNQVDAQVRIMVYDKMGRFVAEVANDGFSQGVHDVSWNGLDVNGNKVPGGMYLYNVMKGDGGVPLKGVVVAK